MPISILHPGRFADPHPLRSLYFSFPRSRIVERISKTFSHHQRETLLAPRSALYRNWDEIPVKLGADEPCSPPPIHIVRLLFVQRLTNRSSSVNSSVMPRATGTWLGFLIRDNPSLLGEESHELGAFAKKISFRLFVDRFLLPPPPPWGDYPSKTIRFRSNGTMSSRTSVTGIRYRWILYLKKKKKRRKVSEEEFSRHWEFWNRFLVLKI